MNRKVYKSGARHVVYKVFAVCMAEFQAGKLLCELDDVYVRTAIMTGVSESTVRRIVEEGTKTGSVFHTPGKHRLGRPKKEIDDFDLCAIRQKVHFCYTVQKEVPTLRKLLAVVKKDLNFDGSHEHLRKILISLGFKFKKCQTNRQTLIEKPIIAAKREHYLKLIIENRKLPEELQKNVIYLDESYIHESYKVAKCWQSLNVGGVRKDISKGKRWIIVHAGGAKGFVPNALLIFTGKNKQEDYHSEMNSHNFTKWVTEKLLPNLTEPSIIVMDNAPYHSIITNKAPTSASKVEEIKLWLLENNIPFEESFRKPSLLMLVKKHKPEPVYYIDELLGEHGHIVVRLPPYHCDLNPIELIWAIVKRRIAEKNVGSQNVAKLAEEAFQSVTPQEWKNCVDHVIKIENEYFSRGETLYNNIDRLVITVGDDSSSESEEEEELDQAIFGTETGHRDADAGGSSYPVAGAGDSSSSSRQISGVEYLDFDYLDSD